MGEHSSPCCCPGPETLSNNNNKMAVWARLRPLTRLRPLQFTKRGAATKEAAEAAPSRTQEEISKWVKEQEGKYWQSYGMVPFARKRDKIEFHISTFALTGFICYGIFWYYYRGDPDHKKWAKREAMILCRQREAAGVPYVNVNFVDPDKLELPTDEELAGATIIL